MSMQRDDIILRNAILHIMDSTVGMPVLSDTLLELNPDLNDFLRDHIFRLLSSDDLKKCRFSEASEVGGLLKDFAEAQLLPVSRQAANLLYSIMNANISIPAGDVFFVTYQLESSCRLAILKMNYREYYVHYTEPVLDDRTGCEYPGNSSTSGDDANYSRLNDDTPHYGNSNDVVKQKAALPGSGRLSEAAFYDPQDGSLLLAEKKYEVNGEKVNYFSELFLQCSTHMSQKAKLTLVTKAVEQINKKYFGEDLEKQLETKRVIHEDIVTQGSLVPESVGEKLYGQVPEIQEEFTEKLEKYHMATEEVKPSHPSTVKKFEKQFLTTDTGIEINIPMEEYNNREHVEFITNPDGTISVLIKNINHLQSK